MGSYAVHRQSFLIEGMDAGPWRPAPLLGEHTDYVLRDVLGLTDEEIAGYAVSGVFQ
jgi:crotonobetainyl-CoA:carnitine CoA-transferase CaiB-like acyl-CoA transferase